MEGGSPAAGLSQYRQEGFDTLKTYWSMWPLFHFINFRLTPPAFRIATIAGFSYTWQVVLSVMSHGTHEQPLAVQAPGTASKDNDDK